MLVLLFFSTAPSYLQATSFSQMCERDRERERDDREVSVCVSVCQREREKESEWVG